MLQDAVRTSMYQTAILSNGHKLIKDRTILDVGAGSGTGTGDGEGPGIGTGKGGGVSFSLAGRKWNRPPPLPKDNTQETGKVVVDITVDKNGQVVSATPGGRGSTTTSAYLFRLAKEAAMKAKFDENPEAADIQRGTITFIFVVQ